MPFLKKVTGDPAGQYIELKAEEMTIGRSPECDINLASGGVSRKHAQFRRKGDEVSLVDLKSHNKTKLNNVELVPERPYLLQAGDRINICDVEFIYHSKLPVPSTRRRGGEGGELMIVTEGGPDESSVHTLDASRSSVVGAADPRTKLQAILEITRNLSSDLNIDTVAPKVLDSLFALYPQAERAFLVLKDAATGRLIRKAFKHRPPRSALGRGSSLSAVSPKDEAPTSLSRTIVNYVMEQKRAVLSSDAGHDADLPTSASIADLKIRSVMCAPLLAPDGQVLGILQLDTTASKQFQQDDLDLLVAVASQAAIAIQNAVMHETLVSKERLDRDLKLAERIQKGFLPQAVPKVPGYEFFAHYSPAYEVGGDLYDFVPLPGNRIAIALGDVSGKGVAAALMMAKFSGDVRYCILTEGAPGPAAEALNQLLVAAGIAEKFITLSLGVLDLDARRLTFCSAGHLPIMIRRARGFVEEVGVDVGDLPLGIMADSRYAQAQVTLEPGDVAVVYSDGVTDARGPQDEPYDSVENRRLLRRVEDAKGGPEVVGRTILQELREFSAGRTQFDDITLVCFGPTASTAAVHPGETLPIPGAGDTRTQPRPR